MKYYQIIGYKNFKRVYQSRLISNFERICEMNTKISNDFPEILFRIVVL